MVILMDVVSEYCEWKIALIIVQIGCVKLSHANCQPLLTHQSLALGKGTDKSEVIVCTCRPAVRYYCKRVA